MSKNKKRSTENKETIILRSPWEHKTHLYEDNLRPIDIINMLSCVSTIYIIGVCAYLEILAYRYGKVFEEHYIKVLYDDELYKRAVLNVNPNNEDCNENWSVINFYGFLSVKLFDEEFAFKNWSEEKIRKNYTEYDFDGSKDVLIDSEVLFDFLKFKKMTGFNEKFIFNKNIAKT